MKTEKLNQPLPEEHRVTTELIMFDALLNLVKSLADKHSVAEKGRQELPRRQITEILTVQFSIFMPKPLEGYKKASYSPSILMELGSLEIEKDTGRISGSVERKFVRRAHLETGSPYYKDKHEQASTDLAEIDEMFFRYKTSLEAPQSDE